MNEKCREMNERQPFIYDELIKSKQTLLYIVYIFGVPLKCQNFNIRFYNSPEIM